jgi:hypothetical protein
MHAPLQTLPGRQHFKERKALPTAPVRHYRGVPKPTLPSPKRGVLMTTPFEIVTFSPRKKFVLRHLDRKHVRSGKVPTADPPVASAQL